MTGAETLQEAATLRQEVRSALLAAGRPACLAEEIAALCEETFLHRLGCEDSAAEGVA